MKDNIFDSSMDDYLLLSEVKSLHHAIDINDIAEVELILNREGNNAKELLIYEYDGWNGFHKAITQGHEDMVRSMLHILGNVENGIYDLLREPNDDGQEALHAAAQKGNIGVLKLLLNAAGDKVFTLLESQDGICYGPLHHAVLNEGDEAIEMIQLLLDAAGDKAQYLINLSFGDETIYNSALQDACTGGHTDIVKLFLKL